MKTLPKNRHVIVIYFPLDGNDCPTSLDPLESLIIRSVYSLALSFRPNSQRNIPAWYRLLGVALLRSSLTFASSSWITSLSVNIKTSVRILSESVYILVEESVLPYLGLSFFSQHRQVPLMCRGTRLDYLLLCPTLLWLLWFDLWWNHEINVELTKWQESNQNRLIVLFIWSCRCLPCIKVPYAWKKL